MMLQLFGQPILTLGDKRQGLGCNHLVRLCDIDDADLFCRQLRQFLPVARRLQTDVIRREIAVDSRSQVLQGFFRRKVQVNGQVGETSPPKLRPRARASRVSSSSWYQSCPLIAA